MGQTVAEILDNVVTKLSDKNYEPSVAFYRVWFGIGRRYHQITYDQAFNAIWSKRTALGPTGSALVHPPAHLFVRFISSVDTEPDSPPAPPTSGLQSRLTTRTLKEFFSSNLRIMSDNGDKEANFLTDANLIAHWANLGCVEETTIRNYILQSLITRPKLYDRLAEALIITFKIAGATFEEYVDPAVIDRCFNLLKARYSRGSAKGRLVQELVALRERNWEGLPPPPVFTIGEPRQTGVRQGDPTATPVPAFLGLPNRDTEPQTLQPSPLELVAAPEIDPIQVFATTPVTRSPSISIATLSDFTIADASDDESPIGPTAAIPHETFYLEDGNAEVLCGNTLFRVHTTVLSFHSPALRRMFSQNSLATAESPNGCPRIQSSDTSNDFVTLLKTVYLPGFPERNKVPDFTTFSSLLRIATKYKIPAIRSQLLEVVRDAYPETFEGLAPSKPLGESIFGGPTHPNEVLNLFVQQKLTSALPMAYYMAAQRGVDSLMDRRLPASAILSLGVLQIAIRGLIVLREAELNETRCLIFGQKGSHPCSTSNCLSYTPTDPAALEAYQKVFDHIVGSPQLGTNLLQVPEFHGDRRGDLQHAGLGVCSNCVERWKSGHAELRKKAWGMLPGVFGLKD